jgi:hypothetical protein
LFFFYLALSLIVFFSLLVQLRFGGFLVVLLLVQVRADRSLSSLQLSELFRFPLLPLVQASRHGYYGS